MKRHFARRVAGIAPFHVMALLSKAREMEEGGREVIHMEIGEPDFATPAPIIRAGQEALANGRTHYTPALGLPALRRAISGHYRDHYGIEVPWQRIVVTPGGSGALLLACAALVDDGDRVLLTDPGYPCNKHFVRLFGGEAVAVAVGSQTGYQFDGSSVVDNWDDRTVAAMLASPANPTGTLVAPTVLEDVIRLISQRDGSLIMDEIYHGLEYGGHAQTALRYSDDVFVINSFSKYFGMTGWRLGWMVVPEEYVDGIERIAQNVFLAPSTPAQYAALAAFSPETKALLEERRLIFRDRRDYLLPAIRELGFSVPVTPDGAFYIYANCSKFTSDSFAFAQDILDKTGVVITPGADFSDIDPQNYVRFAYTTDLAKLKRAVQKLSDYLPC